MGWVIQSTTVPNFRLSERITREVDATHHLNADAPVLLDRVVGLCTDKVSLAKATETSQAQRHQ